MHTPTGSAVGTFAITLAVCGVTSFEARAELPQLRLVEIESADGFTPRAINSEGLIVGGIGSIGTTDEQPAYWSASSGVQLLNTLSGSGYAFAVAETGQIGGTDGTNTPDNVAVRWPNFDADPVPLEFPPTSRQFAAVTGLTDSGMAAGYVSPSAGTGLIAARWSADGVVQILDELPNNPNSIPLSFANSINNNGITVGVDDALSNDSSFVLTPVRWALDGSVEALPLPDGSTGSSLAAWDINDAGRVTGTGGTQPLLWDENDDLIPLATLPEAGPTEAFTTIDDADRVFSTLSIAGQDAATLWLDPLNGSTPVVVNDLLLGSFSGWDIVRAVDIADSDDGFVLAALGSFQGGPLQPVLLTTAIPEPGSACLILATASLLLRRRHH